MADVRRFRAESDHQSPLGFAIGHAETEPKLFLFDPHLFVHGQEQCRHLLPPC
jgi:hypothetical protein